MRLKMTRKSREALLCWHYRGRFWRRKYGDGLKNKVSRLLEILLEPGVNGVRWHPSDPSPGYAMVVRWSPDHGWLSPNERYGQTKRLLSLIAALDTPRSPNRDTSGKTVHPWKWEHPDFII